MAPVSITLRDLWLPVRRRVDFKLAVLVYRLQGSTRSRAAVPLRRLSVGGVSRRLWSADARTYVVPRTRTKFCDMRFAVAGPWVWNSLPAPLRDTNNIYSFRKQLKTCLFSGVFSARLYSYLLTYLRSVSWRTAAHLSLASIFLPALYRVASCLCY